MAKLLRRTRRARPFPRVFLISPAHSGGERAGYLLRPQASFALALQLRTANGAPLADVFTFTSGLYFRGKRAYAERFAGPPEGVPAACVIAPGYGLLPLGVRVRREDLLAFAEVPVDPRDPRYRIPLERDAQALLPHLGAEGRVVLLGSVASGKYTSILLEVFGQRLLFPPAFVGRGDMSRGGLLLRAADSGEELAYAPVAGAVLHGPRPPRLPRRARPRDAVEKGGAPRRRKP